MILGIDPSTFVEQKRIANSKYYKDGKEINPFFEIKKNSVTHLRLRIWNNPHDENGNDYLAGTCDVDSTIELHNLVKEFGFKYIIDFHYSDFWADPAKQYLPKAWANYSLEQLEIAIYDFTKESLIKLKNAGLDVEFVQIGNEITNGMCWPIGKITEDKKASYDAIARIIISGIKAAKEVYPEVKEILHLEKSYDQETYREYISNMLERGVPIDVLGSSYYPFWHHTFEEYCANMDMVQREFKLTVMHAELDFALTLEDYKEGENGKKKHLVINADNIEEFKKMMPYECSPEGQATFVREFLRLAKEHNLIGVNYWEPFWIPGDGICWASDAAQKYMHTEAKDTRNEWANQCLFDYEGNMLPSFMEYKL